MNVIYIRTSTLDQHPENQLRDCLRMGKGKVFSEKESAWKQSTLRSEFNAVKRLIKARKVQYFIVWDLDRIYRNRKKLVIFFKFCKIYGCKVLSYRQQWLNELNKIPEPFGDIMHSLMLEIMGWLAEEESNKKSERVKASIRKVDGVTKSYRGKKWGRKQIPLPAKNKVIELYKEGISMRKISDKVQYTDKNNNMKYLSLGIVHKIITEFKGESQ